MIRFFVRHPTAANLVMIGFILVGLAFAGTIKRRDLSRNTVQVGGSAGAFSGGLGAGRGRRHLPAHRERGGRHRQPRGDPLRGPGRAGGGHPGDARGRRPRPLPRRRQEPGRRHPGLSRRGRAAGGAATGAEGHGCEHCRGRAVAAGRTEGLRGTRQGRPAGDSGGGPGPAPGFLPASDPHRGPGLHHAPVRAQRGRPGPMP